MGEGAAVPSFLPSFLSPPGVAPAGGREAHGTLGFSGYPAAAREGRADPQPAPRPTPPQTPARAVRRRAYARVTRAARRDRSPPAAAPDSCGPDGAPLPGPEVGEGGREEDIADGAEEVSRRAHREPTPGVPDSLHLGGRRRRSACDCPSRGGKARAPFSRLMAKRPSDRRSPGRNPGPQGAFEVSMINVSCNSH